MTPTTPATSTITPALHKLDLAALGAMGGGRVARVLESAIDKAITDCILCGIRREARVVTIDISIEPNTAAFAARDFFGFVSVSISDEPVIERHACTSVLPDRSCGDAPRVLLVGDEPGAAHAALSKECRCSRCTLSRKQGDPAPH